MRLVWEERSGKCCERGVSGGVVWLYSFCMTGEFVWCDELGTRAKGDGVGLSGMGFWVYKKG